MHLAKHRDVLVFLNAYRNNLQAHEITVVAFNPKVFRVSYFSQGIEALIYLVCPRTTQG
jgi:hypothetical protein